MFGDRIRKPGVVEELFPVKIVACHIARPTAATERIRGRLTIEPTAAICCCVGHIAVYPAYISFEGKFDFAVVNFSVD